MEPEITPLEEENHLPNQHVQCWGSMLILEAVCRNVNLHLELRFRAPSGCLDSKPRSLASNRKDQHLGMIFVVSKNFYGGWWLSWKVKHIHDINIILQWGQMRSDEALIKLTLKLYMRPFTPATNPFFYPSKARDKSQTLRGDDAIDRDLATYLEWWNATSRFVIELIQLGIRWKPKIT